MRFLKLSSSFQTQIHKLRVPQDPGQDAGVPGEAGEGERIRRDPGRGEPHLQLGRRPHLRRHRLAGLVPGQQQHRPVQPPLPPPPEPPSPLQPPGQRPAPGGPVRPSQQATQRTPGRSRKVGLELKDQQCLQLSTFLNHSNATN